MENNNFIFIQTTNNYIAIEENKQYYTFFTQDRIEKCHTIKQTMICELETPLLTNTKDTCEFLLFKQNVLPISCAVHSVKLYQDIWHKLKDMNKWLHATYQPKC